MADTDSPPDIRDTLAAAFDDAEKASEAAAPPPPQPAQQEAAPEGDAESAAASEARARDDKGRFAPKPPSDHDRAKAARNWLEQPAAQRTETEAKGPPATASVSAAVPPTAGASSATTTPPLRAPQSWTPAEREEFSKLPKVAQEAVLRREGEHTKLLQESAEHRNGYQSFQKVVAPYEGLIRSRGGEPVQVMETALRAYVGLHTSPPHVQAQMLAGMVRSLRVPIDALDAALSGEAQATPQQQPQVDEAAIERRLLERIEKQRTAQEVSSWSQGKEYFDDVRDTMQALLLAAAQRGHEMTLDQAYERACRADPQISGVLEARKAEESKKAREAELAQKRVAATSVRSSPAGRMNGAAPGKSVSDFVQRAWDAQEGV